MCSSTSQVEEPQKSFLKNRKDSAKKRIHFKKETSKKPRQRNRKKDRKCEFREGIEERERGTQNWIGAEEKREGNGEETVVGRRRRRGR